MQRSMKNQFPILLLTLAVIAYRISAGIVGGHLGMFLANFTPLVALSLVLGIFLKRPAAIAWVVAVPVISDVILAVVKKTTLTWAVAGYVAIPAVIYIALAFVGPALRRHFSWQKCLGGVFAATVAFYLLANTYSFAMDASYAKTAAGWLQAQTLGVPGYPPAYLFLVKSLLGNLTFAGLFLLACGRPAVTRSLAASTASDSEISPLHA
jgi:hypothetical protein